MPLTAEMLGGVFVGASKAAIAANLPIVLDALEKEGLAYREMIAMALATIRVETASFKPIDEGRSRYNTKDVPFDLYDAGTRIGKKLGNVRPGDGARYKGRGFVQLTGRDNYRTIGARIGEDLENHPERANEPKVAAAILASFLKRDEATIRRALLKGDMKAARRLVNGGTHGLERFADTYHRIFRLIDREDVAPPPGPIPPVPPKEKQANAISGMPDREKQPISIKKISTVAVAAGAPAAGVVTSGIFDGWQIIILIVVLLIAAGCAIHYFGLRKHFFAMPLAFLLLAGPARADPYTLDNAAAERAAAEFMREILKGLGDIDTLIPIPLPPRIAEHIPPHQWIIDGNFGCCTPEQHCWPINYSQVERLPDGSARVTWLDGTGKIQQTAVSKDRIRPSQDGLLWFCSPGCLFWPPEA